MTVIHLGGK